MSSLVSLFRGKSYDGSLIANIISFAALASLTGKLLVGYLLDRIRAPLLSGIVFMIAAGRFVVLLTTPGPVGSFIGAGFVAMALGAEGDILTYLVSRYFPLVEFSRVVGVIWVYWAWGGGVGTSIAAASLAAGYGYVPVFVLFALLLGAGALTLSFLGPYLSPQST